MDLSDIRQSVLYQINDVDDLAKLCYADKMSERLCSTKEFWLHWYQKHHIQFPNHIYDNAQDWIDEYQHIKSLMTKANILIDQLNDNNALVFGFNTQKQNYTLLMLDEDEKDEVLMDFIKKTRLFYSLITYQSEPVGWYNISYHSLAGNIFNADHSIELIRINKKSIINYIYNLFEADVKIYVTDKTDRRSIFNII